MKLEDARQAYYDYSGTVSTLTRSMCFAGIAIAWVVRLGNSADIKYADSCGWVFVLLIGSLAFDYLQYVLQAATWGIYNAREHSKGVKLDDEVAPPAWFNSWPIAFWVAKAALALAGIGCLGYNLLGPIIKNPRFEVPKPPAADAQSVAPRAPGAAGE